MCPGMSLRPDARLLPIGPGVSLRLEILLPQLLLLRGRSLRLA